MNFLDCVVEENAAALALRLSNDVRLQIPAGRTARYRAYIGRPMTVGLRPEHITEPRPHEQGDFVGFDVLLDVVEPMGVETEVFFLVDSNQVCCRVDPRSAGMAGSSMRLSANMSHMHLIDPASNLVV